MDTDSAFPGFLSGEKFKNAETDTQTFLPAGVFAAIRVDGKGFSKFTKTANYAVPFCEDFSGIMDYAAQELFKSVTGALFAYVQSDEISVVFSDRLGESTEWWFGGKVQKIVSLTSANASVAFARKEWERTGSTESTPIFDSRVLLLKDAKDIEEYIRWRRFDAQKNSVSMAASSKFSHSQLQGVSSKGRAAMLQGTELETLPDRFYNGRIIYRDKVLREGVNQLTGEMTSVRRTEIKTAPATREFMERVFPKILKGQKISPLK